MSISVKNRVDLEKLAGLTCLKKQVEELRLQDKLGKQNFHDDFKNFYELPTDAIEDTSEGITKTMLVISKHINDKLLEQMKDRGTNASYLMSPLSKITNPEHTNQYKLVKDPSSNRFNDLLINKTKPVSL